MFPLPYTMLSVLYRQDQIDAGIAAPASVPDSCWRPRASRPRRSVTAFRTRRLASSVESRRLRPARSR
jgi:hypothetical protein